MKPSKPTRMKWKDLPFDIRVLFVASLVLGFGGGIWLLLLDWKIALAVFLIFWGHNCETRAEQKMEKIENFAQRLKSALQNSDKNGTKISDDQGMADIPQDDTATTR